MAVENYYELLGIDQSADADAIKVAIRKARNRYRQVAGSPNKEQARNAEVMIEKLANAEKVLADPAHRRAHDEELRSQPAEEPKSAPVDESADWVGAAKTYLANGQPRNALEAAKEATRTQSNNVDAWTVRAYASLELRDLVGAEFSASEAQRRDPENAQTSGLLGDVYDAAHRYAEAERAFGRAARLEPQKPYWQGRVAWAIADQGRVKEAVDRSAELLNRFPDIEYARTTHAYMLLKDAESVLSVHGNLTFFTSKNQIAYVQDQLAHVKELGTMSESAVKYAAELTERVTLAGKRKLELPEMKVLGAYLLGFPIALVICISILGAVLGDGLFPAIVTTVLGWGIWGLMTWLFFDRHVWPARWRVVRGLIGPSAKSGLQ